MGYRKWSPWEDYPLPFANDDRPPKRYRRKKTDWGGVFASAFWLYIIWKLL